MKSSNDELIYDGVSEEIINTAEKLAMEKGARDITVRMILNEMGITNRVFYNRFHNIEEVLHIIYSRTFEKMHDSISSEYDIEKDFFEYVMDISLKVLISTYELKNQFSQYMFEADSKSEANRRWWIDRIKSIIEVGKRTNNVKQDIDADLMSYTLWCFFRGYNADVVNRKISKEKAVEGYRQVLSYLIEGIRI